MCAKIYSNRLVFIDCAVSFFHHQKRTFASYEFQDGTFEEYFELFIDGKTEYNDYFTHLLSWYPQTKEANTILIHYEDLKKDPKSEILRLAQFLGEDCHRSLLQNDVLDKVVERSHVDTMKKEYEKYELPIEGATNPGMLEENISIFVFQHSETYRPFPF